MEHEAWQVAGPGLLSTNNTYIANPLFRLSEGGALRRRSARSDLSATTHRHGHPTSTPHQKNLRRIKAPQNQKPKSELVF